MGGYGAVKLGLKHHELFASVNSHSGAARAPPRGDTRRPRSSAPSSPGSSASRPRAAPKTRSPSSNAIDHGRIPALRIDCGNDDFLIDQNRAFHKHLESLHIPHEYEEFPGDHDWAYWDMHVQEAIAFHARNLKLNGRRRIIGRMRIPRGAGRPAARPTGEGQDLGPWGGPPCPSSLHQLADLCQPCYGSEPGKR